jgi:hypothetical protein
MYAGMLSNLYINMFYRANSMCSGANIGLLNP